MPTEYECEYCNYKTTRKYSFERHKTSSKHFRKKYEKLAQSHENKVCTKKTLKTCEFEISPQSDNSIICEYCGKSIRYKKNRAQHYKSCKIRKIKLECDEKIKKIIDKKDRETELIRSQKEKEIEHLIIEKAEMKKTYTDMIQDMSKNQNTQNMFFVFNNYPNTTNYDEFLSPILMDDEIDAIHKMGYHYGCYYIIQNRCINGIEPKNRPFHCVDGARNKFMLKNKDTWKVDHNANEIITKSCDKMLKYFNECNYTPEERFNIMVKMTNLELKDKPKIRDQLKTDTLLSNTRNLL